MSKSLEMKRICLIAGHDKDGIIHDYVVKLAGSLSKIATTYYFCDNHLAHEQAIKLSGIATICGTRQHGRYDFGSWSEMIKKIGWRTVGGCDELILVNDSCYGPIYDLAAAFEKMQSIPCDFWSMTSSFEISFHLQSYFLVFRKEILNDNYFRDFWNNIEVQKHYIDIVKRYEVGLSKLLLDRGYRADTYISSRVRANLTVFPLTLIRDHSMPFIKVKCIKDPYVGCWEPIPHLYTFLKNRFPETRRLISRHQKHGFSKAALAQKENTPLYFNTTFLVCRAIRGNRLKILIFGKWKIFIPANHTFIKKLSRLSFFKPRL